MAGKVAAVSSDIPDDGTHLIAKRFYTNPYTLRRHAVSAPDLVAGLTKPQTGSRVVSLVGAAGEKLDKIALMTGSTSRGSKLPEITLTFWVIKIAATTLGETAGDAVSMSLQLGYLIGTAIFLGAFVATVFAQVAARRFHPFLYWSVIVASTTAGTTMADFFDRSLGIGYLGGTSILLVLLLGSLGIWYRSLGSVSVATVTSPAAEMFYWATIMLSQTLGTALAGC